MSIIHLDTTTNKYMYNNFLFILILSYIDCLYVISYGLMTCIVDIKDYNVTIHAYQ